MTDKKTIALLLDSLNENYNNLCWQGCVFEARKQGVNLLCFPGGALHQDKRFYQYRNSIYDLIDKDKIDGIVAISGGLANYCTPGELLNFLKAFAPLPLMSIGIPLPGIHSLTVNNYQGMYDLVSHFIKIHQKKNIAFIRGPRDSEDTESRFQAYKQALEDNGLPLREELIFQGDFLREGGREAGEYFLNRGKKIIDAVIGATDYMTLSTMKEFLDRGIHIPGEIAFGGFDNLQKHLNTNIPLTTVRQPIWQMGRQAVINLIRLIKGDTVHEQMQIATHLIIRHSCGCQGNHNGNKPLEEMIPPLGDKNLINRLYRTLTENLNTPEQFYKTLKEEIAAKSARGISYTAWLELLPRIFQPFPPQSRNTVEILTKSLILVGQMAEEGLSRRYENRREQDSLLNVESLLTAVDMNKLAQLLTGDLPRLGIESAYLSLYTPSPEKGCPRAGDRAFLFCYYHRKTPELNLSRSPYPSNQLVPGGTPQGEHMVLPLFFQEEIFGFGVFEIGQITDGMIFENIITQLNAALKNFQMMEEIRHYASSLELMVEDRTYKLKTIQEQLIASARKSGMADVAINVIHNTNNILNTISVAAQSISESLEKTSISRLKKANDLLTANKHRLAEFFTTDPRGESLIQYYSQLYKSLEEEQQNLTREVERILQKNNELQHFITQQEQYTQNISLSQEEHLPTLLDNILEELKADLKNNGIILEKKYSRKDALILEIEQSKLNGVLKELIKNSLEAMKEQPEKRLIIAAGEEENEEGSRRYISITDTGCGISRENLKKIFQMGFTTKCNHTGFNLHACANLLQEMKGQISADSPGPGKGATFTLSWK